MYTILEREHVAVNGVSTMYRLTIQVDTEADVPTPDDTWAIGSMCLIADGHGVKILNSKGEWV